MSPVSRGRKPKKKSGKAKKRTAPALPFRAGVDSPVRGGPQSGPLAVDQLGGLA